MVLDAGAVVLVALASRTLLLGGRELKGQCHVIELNTNSPKTLNHEAPGLKLAISITQRNEQLEDSNGSGFV